MEATNSFDDKELARRLERVFEIFACAQEDWIMQNTPGKAVSIWEKTPVFQAKTLLTPQGSEAGQCENLC